jgi:hypothetical protein
MTSGFHSPLQVEAVGGLNWRLLCDLTWEGTQGDKITKRKGTYTDFASTPSLLQSIFPSIGPWVKAAVIHDELCDRLNDYYEFHSLFSETGRPLHPDVVKPAFDAVDTDHVFRLIMKQEGVGWLRRNIGWVGVRWGALRNPARREGWTETLWPVLGLSTLFLAAALVLPALLVIAGLAA